MMGIKVEGIGMILIVEDFGRRRRAEWDSRIQKYGAVVEVSKLWWTHATILAKNYLTESDFEVLYRWI